jgi:hypothetical protein
MISNNISTNNSEHDKTEDVPVIVKSDMDDNTNPDMSYNTIDVLIPSSASVCTVLHKNTTLMNNDNKNNISNHNINETEDVIINEHDNMIHSSDLLLPIQLRINRAKMTILLC